VYCRRACASRAVRGLRRTVLQFAGTGIPFNAAIPGERALEYCRFGTDGFGRYKQVVETTELSTRSMGRVAKVARTIADLDRSEKVDPNHVNEAAAI
jgi:magnesium chelatase family protein